MARLDPLYQGLVQQLLPQPQLAQAQQPVMPAVLQTTALRPLDPLYQGLGQQLLPQPQLAQAQQPVMPAALQTTALGPEQASPANPLGQRVAPWIVERYGDVFRRRADDIKAIDKANRLLKKFLTPDQLAEYKATDRITIINGKTSYSIGKDLLVSVRDIDDYPFAPPLEIWCVRLPGTPIADSLLAQLLLLRSSPGKLRKMACVTRSRRGTSYARARTLLQRAGYVA